MNTKQRILNEQAKKRVTKALDMIEKTFGPLDREDLGAMLDGAQDAWSNWMPKGVKTGAENTKRCAVCFITGDHASPQAAHAHGMYR